LHYRDLVSIDTVSLGPVALGRPFHAALVRIGPRDARSLPHAHADLCEFCYVVRGRGAQRIGLDWQQLQCGDLVLIRRTDVHTFAAAPRSELHFINVAFAATAWRDFLTLADIDASRRWDRQPVPPLRRLSGDDAAEADAVFHRALARFDDRPTTVDLIRFWADAVALLDRPEPDVDANRPEWLTRACTEMRLEDNLREGLPRLLELAAVSHGHLARSMRQHFNATPVEFITDLRLRHAAALLTSSADPIGQIALRCGFTSQSYFCRRFQAGQGMSPRQFRDRTRRLVVP